MILERLMRSSGRRWLGKGFWALTDQALFALSNFGLNIMLARWLTAAEYGAWSLAFSALLLVGAFHTALFAEPMLVFGPSRYRHCTRAYIAALVRGHWVAMVPIGGAFAGLGFLAIFTGRPELGSTTIAFALAGPCVLFQWLTRRACYTQLRPDMAASAGGVYMAVVLAGTYGLFRTGNLSVLLAVGLMALGSLVSGTWLAWRLRVIDDVSSPGELGRGILKSHWDYGRWAIAINAMSWVPGNIAYLVLPFSGGLSSVAALRAIMNVLLPVQHIIGAISGLLLPLFARSRGSDRFPRLVAFLLVCFGATTAAAWIATALLAEPLIATLYQGRYVEHARLLWLLGLIPVAAGQQAVLGGALRALERPDKVFWPYLVSSVGAATIGVGVVLTWGVTGAAYVLAISGCVCSAGMAWQLRSVGLREVAGAHTAPAQQATVLES